MNKYKVYLADGRTVEIFAGNETDAKWTAEHMQPYSTVKKIELRPAGC